MQELKYRLHIGSAWKEGSSLSMKKKSKKHILVFNLLSRLGETNNFYNINKVVRHEKIKTFREKLLSITFYKF